MESGALRKQSSEPNVDAERFQKRILRYAVCFAFLSALIATSHRILRETVRKLMLLNECLQTTFVPLFALATLITSLVLCTGIFIRVYLFCRKSEADKKPYLPCECLVSMFLLTQIILNFSKWKMLFEVVWLLIGELQWIFKN